MELDGAGTCSFYLVDGVGHVGVVNVGLVCGVVEDDCIVGQGVVDPSLQFFFAEGGARRVVGVAQVDEVYALFGKLGDEIVFGRAGEVGDVRPFSVGAQLSGASAHYVGVDVDGVDRVGEAYAVVAAEYVSEVSGVAFCSVADEYFGGVYVDSAGAEVVVDDGLYEEVVSLLRSVAAEGGCVAQFGDGFLHGLYGCLGEGAGYVAYAQPDEGSFGMGGFELCYFLPDFVEEVIAGKFEELFVC